MTFIRSSSRLLTRARKSKLRQKNDAEPDMGADYAGAKISRDALIEQDSDKDAFHGLDDEEDSDNEVYADPDQDLDGMEENGDEEIDSDDAFESGDEKKFGGYKFSGSMISKPDGGQDPSEEEAGGPKIPGEHEITDASEDDFEGISSDSQKDDDQDASDHMKEDDSEDSSADDSDTSMSDSSPGKSGTDDRAAVRKMMAEEHTTVAATLSNAKADIEKGRAIKHQRSTFDSLLNTRIKLQKALIATNTMAASSTGPNADTSTILAAETAALNLWNSLSALRSSLTLSSEASSLTATPSTPSSALWTHMTAQESISLPTRRSTLTNWSNRTNPTLPRISKFSQTPTTQPLTSVLDSHLIGTNASKLVSKTRTPRSCAPVQAAARVSEDADIYDDADFYTLLLRELVDQRMADGSANTAQGAGVPSLPSQRQFKVKKVVDTKASKGRKMRYTVHEKLQNFMAPEGRGAWGERQRGELFGSLLGARVRLEEGGESEEGVLVDGMDGEGEGGLRLFG